MKIYPRDGQLAKRIHVGNLAGERVVTILNNAMLALDTRSLGDKNDTGFPSPVLQIDDLRFPLDESLSSGELNLIPARGQYRLR